MYENAITRYTWDELVINSAGTFAGFSAQYSPVSIIGQTIQNSTSALATATYKVTPKVNNCDGETSMSYYAETLDSTKLYCSDIVYIEVKEGFLTDNSNSENYANLPFVVV